MKRHYIHFGRNRGLLFYPILIISFIAVVSQTSCKKLVDVSSPVTSTSERLVFSSDATAAAVLTGIYANLSSPSINSPGAPNSLSFFGGLLADEFKLHTGI